MPSTPISGFGDPAHASTAVTPPHAAVWRRWRALPTKTSPWLHEEVAQRMEQRLDFMRRQPATWAHWEPLRGGMQAHQRLARRYPDAECFVVEAQAQRAQAAMKTIAPWWHRVLGQVPVKQGIPTQGVDMLWANMDLHLQPDPLATLSQWAAALTPQGFVMFSCLGPDTVHELRALYAELGWPPPAQTYTDMHDWGDALLHAGFAEPVVDMERITLQFVSPERLLLELRELGRNAHPQRFAALRGRRWHARLLQALQRRGTELTFEIVYGHALKAPPRAALQDETVVGIETMRALLRQGKGNLPGR